MSARLDTVVGELVSELTQMLAAQGAVILLCERGPDLPPLERTYGGDGQPDASEAAWPPEVRSLLLQCIASGRSSLLPPAEGRGGHWLAVSIHSGATSFGAIGAAGTPGSPFTRGQVLAAEAMARIAAQVLEECVAHEQTRKASLDLSLRVSDYQAALDALPIGVGFTSERTGQQIVGNRWLRRMLGPTSGQAGARLHRDGRPLDPQELPIQWAAATGRAVECAEMQLVREGATVATIMGHAAPLLGPDGKAHGAVGAFLDVTESKRAEAKAAREAYHDSLTGLPNRLLFGDRLQQAVAQASRRGTSVGVMVIDLDGFKLINDSLGHRAGDRLLCGIGKRLSDCVRAEDTVARLGGDEFGLVLPSIAVPADAARVARKIMDRLRYACESDGAQFYLTVCIGIATGPEDGTDHEELLRKADTAMYRAKESGRNSYRFFKPALHRRALERLQLERSLHTALERNELSLDYQPIIDGADGSLHGVEALLRWQHPELGSIPPAEFVPLAESVGALRAIEPWVLREACSQTRSWQQMFDIPLSVSVNLSPSRVADTDLVRTVNAALAESRLPSVSLELEITETSAILDVSGAARSLRRLRASGVRVSVDDFGTGYSSLGYLARFPLDSLKVDRSFVRRIGRHTESAALVKAVIGMAHDLKLTAVAEGVETREQLNLLTSWKCDRIQGYLVGTPLPAAECQRRLAAAQRG